MKVSSKEIFLTTLISVGLVVGVCGWIGSLYESKQNEEDDLKSKIVYKVTITAKRYKFQPEVIRVNQRTPLEITLKSEDVPHGFGIRRPGRIQNFGAFEPGKPLRVMIRTNRKEIIEFFSTVYSGVDYYKMKGKIIVE